MAIQSNIVATDEAIHGSFSNDITFKTDDESVSDNDAVIELASTLNYNIRSKNKSVKKSVVSVVEFVLKNVLNNERKLSGGPLPKDAVLSVYEKVLYRWIQSSDLCTILCRILSNKKTQIESFQWELLFEWLIVTAQKFKPRTAIQQIMLRLNSILAPNHAESKKSSVEAQLFMKFVVDTASNASTHDRFRRFCYGIVRLFESKIDLLTYFYPSALRAMIDCELFYQQIGCSEASSSAFIIKVHAYEKAKKEAERKERAYLAQNAYDLDTLGDDDEDDEDTKTDDENPQQEGQEEDEESTAKMLLKYVGPATLDLIEYYLTFSSITNTICCASQLTDAGLFALLVDQWSLVRSSVTGLVYQTQLIETLIISICAMIARFPYKWNSDKTHNVDQLLQFAALSSLETDVIYDL
eukprot:149559_1